MKPARKCPACENGVEVELLYEQKFEIPDALSGLSETQNIVSCSRCGCVYNDFDASQEDYDRYYHNNSKYETAGLNDSGYPSEGHVNFFKGILREFKEYIHSDSAILDIGCATGGMLAALKSENFNHITGLDISEGCVKSVRNMGIDCHKGGIFNASAAFHGKFDLIIVRQVFEHICDVPRAIRMIRDMIKDGGILYLDVPDVAAYHNHFVKPFHYFDIEHINHFAAGSIVEMGRQAGFICLKIWGRAQNVPSKFPCPELAVLFQKTNMPSKSPKSEYSKCGRDNILRYIAISLKEEEKRLEIIQTLIESKEKIIIWSAGAYCFHFLKKGLACCNVIAIVDSDRKKQGMKVAGIEVKSPDIIKSFCGMIVIASAVYEEEIRAQITAMGVQNKVICL